MKYGILNQLNTILANLQADAATLGLTIAGLMIVISAILILFDTNTTVGAHKDRWSELRKVFICAALITAAGAIISFSKQLGGGLQS